MIDEAELAQLKRDVQQLKDRQSILDCIQRECRARDRQDVAQIAGCWWEDGVDEHGPIVTQAPDYPARANAGHRALFNMTSHNITNHLCELDGDTAYCESYVVGGLFWLDDKRTTIAFGRYLDQLEKRQGEWRILTRRCTIEMSADTDGSWVHSKNVKGFLKALWNGEDPSYERPIVARPDGVRW
ncbi:MAG: nuclear transport factor 2 family protein [Hydrocarboniphaga sp.]|uniref:nuclear transport factor 2 family protein n=1 Tax=Hydrocarboniphaga sp. TaxID=2033016 RepID=UPI00261DBDBC|nr:nuclear transport factor 2 family protein [Hydrocarboniphaga sp.]MDB5970379.1 nuclear transport factor 2 family protein [Hydrocarboniphaga sp.]